MFGLIAAVHSSRSVLSQAATVKPMVGGILGAAAGVDGLPERLRAFPGYEELIAWGSAAAGSGGVGVLPDLFDLERRLSGILVGER